MFLKLATTVLILINTGPSNVKQITTYETHENHKINETDLTHEIHFICTAKFLTFLDGGRICQNCCLNFPRAGFCRPFISSFCVDYYLTFSWPGCL